MNSEPSYPEPIEPIEPVSHVNEHQPASLPDLPLAASELPVDVEQATQAFLPGDALADARFAEAADDIRATLRRASAAYWLTGGPVGDLVRRAIGRTDSPAKPSASAAQVYQWLHADTHKAGAIDAASVQRMREFLDRKL